MNYDDYIELYHSEEDWYFEYVSKELNRIKKRYKNENEVRKRKNQR